MDPDPAPDPTPFISNFKEAKQFYYNLPAGTLSSILKIKFFANILC
jgi:hypothetical protein